MKKIVKIAFCFLALLYFMGCSNDKDEIGNTSREHDLSMESKFEGTSWKFVQDSRTSWIYTFGYGGVFYLIWHESWVTKVYKGTWCCYQDNVLRSSAQKVIPKDFQ